MTQKSPKMSVWNYWNGESLKEESLKAGISKTGNPAQKRKMSKRRNLKKGESLKGGISKMGNLYKGESHVGEQE